MKLFLVIAYLISTVSCQLMVYVFGSMGKGIIQEYYLAGVCESTWGGMTIR